MKNPAKMLLLLGAGVLFGFGLVLSGMTNPAKVIGFLDFFGDWDPDLAFVMAGALAVFGIGLTLARRGDLCSLPDLSADPVSRKMVIGSALFGVGWGLSGFCPGPALANIAALRMDVLWFLPPMILGMIAARRLFGVDG